MILDVQRTEFFPILQSFVEDLSLDRDAVEDDMRNSSRKEILTIYSEGEG